MTSLCGSEFNRMTQTHLCEREALMFGKLALSAQKASGDNPMCCPCPDTSGFSCCARMACAFSQCQGDRRLLRSSWSVVVSLAQGQILDRNGTLRRSIAPPTDSSKDVFAHSCRTVSRFAASTYAVEGM